jgi:hypothetical protein
MHHLRQREKKYLLHLTIRSFKVKEASKKEQRNRIEMVRTREE